MEPLAGLGVIVGILYLILIGALLLDIVFSLLGTVVTVFGGKPVVEKLLWLIVLWVVPLSGWIWFFLYRN